MIGSNSNGQLKAFIERIEKLDEDKRQISAEMAYVYAEAKANGFDTKIMRKLVALRKKEAAEREEEQSLLEVYMAALGMLADTPLGEAAPDLLWGAAMGAAVEFLLEGGYVTLTRTPGVVMYSITDKGRAALTQQEGETP